MQSIELCVARFDEDTKASFLDLYTKIDAGVDVEGKDVDAENDKILDEVSEDVAAF
jgi:hypothetical protein